MPGQRVTREQCYSPADFRLGSHVSVHGRALLLHDCDAFTRDWLKVGGWVGVVVLGGWLVGWVGGWLGGWWLTGG